MINLKSSRWLRIVAIVILTLGISQAQAQVQTPQYISMGPNTNGYYEYLPQGYNPGASTTYPVIIFMHGIGELGDGSQWGLPRLLNTGLPAIIQYGQFPTSFTVNGQTHKFIVISPQFINWPSPSDVDGVINYVSSHYRVNTSRIYLTGLSMGGGVVWDYCGASVANGNRVAAIVPVCGASWPDHARARTIADANVPVWALHNNYDPTVNVSYTINYVDYINEAPSPNPLAKKSLFDVWSHDAWTNTYNSTYRDETGKSVFEWMLQFTRGGGSTPPPPSNQLPVSNAGPDQNISGTSAQLNGSGTDPDGSISSYTWSQVSGPSTASFSNTNIANPGVSSLVAGSYTFRLTVKDNAFATAYDDVVINVAATPATAVPIPGRVQAESFSSMYGVQTENTADAGGGQDVGWQDNNDWMDYSVNVAATGVYKVDFRVATMFAGPQFQLRKQDGTTLATITVPNTGNFQTWQTVSATVNLSAGQQTIRIYTTQANGGWNMNWMEFAQTVSNQLPVVSAGGTQNVTLPASSATLTGSATDADGWIASYAWSQVSGPSTATISNATSAITSVNALVQGTYTFRLKGTDNTGASATSDVTVNVSASSGTTTSTKIQAESYSGMYGIQTENTSDAGGGQNVGWQDNNDWMDYSVNISSAGTFTVNFRVASMFSGAQFQLRKQDGSVLATITVPNTGSFQTWQTVSASVTLPAGQQTLRIVTTQANGGWNFNWWEIVGSSTPSVPPLVQNIKIEAESFSGMYGIQTENTSDAGGGQNVGWQDNNDWMDYPVNISAAGTFTVNFRVASMFSGAQFQLRKQDGSVLATVTVPNTGNFQTWQTVSASVTLAAGQQTLRIVTTQANGGWNFNWWEIVGGGTASTRAAMTTASAETVAPATSLDVYPNPVQDRFQLQLNNDYTGNVNVQVINMAGAVQKQFTFTKAAKGAMQTYLSIGTLPAGEYVLNVISGSDTQTKKIIKL